MVTGEYINSRQHNQLNERLLIDKDGQHNETLKDTTNKNNIMKEVTREREKEKTIVGKYGHNELKENPVIIKSSITSIVT